MTAAFDRMKRNYRMAFYAGPERRLTGKLKMAERRIPSILFIRSKAVAVSV
jgi:hypothetical protein